MYISVEASEGEIISGFDFLDTLKIKIQTPMFQGVQHKCLLVFGFVWIGFLGF